MGEIKYVVESAEASMYVRLSELKRRNVVVNGRRTSVTLEPQVWNILQEVAEDQGCSIHELCSFIYDRKHPKSSLASAIRVFLISFLDIKLKRGNEENV